MNRSNEHPSQQVARIKLGGEPEEIGRGHGAALKEQIHKSIEIYGFLFGREERAVEETALRFRDSIKDFSPSLVREIDAMAAAADAPLFWLYALNARSEILAYHAPECTALYAPRTKVLAQNWDWIEAFEQSVVVLDIAHSNGRRLLTVTEPGQVGKIGLNAAGLGVCLNFMAGDPPLDGVPIHILLRALLDAQSFEEGLEVIVRAGLGRAGNVIFASACGQSVSLEFTGDALRRIDIDDTPFVHTNHPLGSKPSGSELLENSAQRLQRAEDLLAGRATLAADEAAALLSHQPDDAGAICMSYRPFDGVPGGTICSIVMTLDPPCMRLRKGPRPQQGFEELAF